MHKFSLRGAIVGVVAVALVGVSGCAASSSDDAADTSFTMAVFTTGSTLDPWGSLLNTYAAQASYDTLTHVDNDGNAIPWLATDWEFTDELTLVMDLRDDVTFTDGTPFNADAVKANIDYGKTQNGNAASTLATIDSVEVIDDDTVAFHLVTANPDLPFALSPTGAGYMVSPAALADPDTLATTPVGSGPYLLDEDATISGDTYVYTKNPDYWAADDWDRFDTLNLKIIKNQTASDNAALSNEIDFETVTADTEIPDWTFSDGSLTAFYAFQILDLDGSITPALADVRVRQAMNYAIDRQAILDSVYGGVGEVAASVPMSTDSDGWSDDLLDIYPYDPDKAKELLAEAGYSDGFTIQVLSAPNYSDTAQAIAGYLRAVGIDVELSEHTTDLVQQTMSGTWAVSMSLVPVSGLPFTDFSTTMVPGGLMNPYNNSDPTITQYLEEAASADEADRGAIYTELATYAAEQAWFVGPVITGQRFAYNPDVVAVEEPARVGTPLLYNFTPAA